MLCVGCTHDLSCTHIQVETHVIGFAWITTNEPDPCIDQQMFGTINIISLLALVSVFDLRNLYFGYYTSLQSLNSFIGYIIRLQILVQMQLF